VLGFAADRGGLCPATDRPPDEYDAHSLGNVGYARTLRRRSTCVSWRRISIIFRRAVHYAALSSRAPLFLSTVRDFSESAPSRSIARPALLTLLRTYSCAEANAKFHTPAKDTQVQ
jgi:hypothetical protein